MMLISRYNSGSKPCGMSLTKSPVSVNSQNNSYETYTASTNFTAHQDARRA